MTTAFVPRAACTAQWGRRDAGFTLVELLVVITIMGILAALIAGAIAGASRRAKQAQIETEISKINTALHAYKDVAGSFPPNAQTDDADLSIEPPSSPTPLNESQVVQDVKRHLKQSFGKNNEPDFLIAALAGIADSNPAVTHNLQGGMTAGEALVFWLGGFSADVKYPISGEGGPSYPVVDASRGINIPVAERGKHDPLQRNWIMPFAVDRLGPRTIDKKFDDSASAGQRYIEYTIAIKGIPQTRRINMWQYVPSQSEQPYLYFDTSRHPATPDFDPPAATGIAAGVAAEIYAIKQRPESASAAVPIEFCNRDKYQILHAGVDDAWGDFGPISAKVAGLFYPDGPFTGEVADTLTNFSEGTLEASQP